MTIPVVGCCQTAGTTQVPSTSNGQPSLSLSDKQGSCWTTLGRSGRGGVPGTHGGNELAMRAIPRPVRPGAKLGGKFPSGDRDEGGSWLGNLHPADQRCFMAILIAPSGCTCLPPSPSAQFSSPLRRKENTKQAIPRNLCFISTRYQLDCLISFFPELDIDGFLFGQPLPDHGRTWAITSTGHPPLSSTLTW